MRETWDNAPTNRDLDGARVRIRGYVVPLEAHKGELREFLLVPYAGACIHTPPPPANQIIHVTLAEPIKDVRTMDTVRASGTLRTARSDSPMGVSGYTLQAVHVQNAVRPSPGSSDTEPVNSRKMPRKEGLSRIDMNAG